MGHTRHFAQLAQSGVGVSGRKGVKLPLLRGSRTALCEGSDEVSQVRLVWPSGSREPSELKSMTLQLVEVVARIPNRYPSRLKLMTCCSSYLWY
jgi:hypothetical protein